MRKRGTAMNIIEFFKALEALDIGFYTGVPDSTLKALSEYLETGGQGITHLVAPDEGAAVALAAGHHLATGRVPMVYLQNSGLGNAVNPLASLVSERVYGIPMLLVIGWRGEPGKLDEPQHQLQGEITPGLLEALGIGHAVLGPETGFLEVAEKMSEIQSKFSAGQSFAFLVSRGTFATVKPAESPPAFCREAVIERILRHTKEDPVIATTGRTARELYEIRARQQGGHHRDFLNIGAMGHALGIALGMALSSRKDRIWCLDGDGAVLMHLAVMAQVGSEGPGNLIHVLFNNGGHESVGGQALGTQGLDFQSLARTFAYPLVLEAVDFETLEGALETLRRGRGPAFLEVKISMGSREDLGRPQRPPGLIKEHFMAHLREGEV
jgi:phosphonopyruvate decarboxylase